MTDAKIADLRATWMRAVPHPESGRIECSHDEMFTLLIAIPRLLDEVERYREIKGGVGGTPLETQVAINADLVGKNRDLRALLKRIEWSGDAEFAHGGCCPRCWNDKPDGHATGCEIPGLLGVS